MRLEADVTLPFPRDRVFGAYRDHLVDLVPFLPNIRRIEVKSRTEHGDVCDFVNVWHGGGDIPGVARAFLSEDMLAWTDYATWNAADFTCAWRTQTHSFKDAVKAAGNTRYVEVDGGTRIEIRGSIEIDPAGLRGVPGFLAKRAAPAVAEFLVGRIRPNLIEVAEGVRRYLSAEPEG